MLFHFWCRLLARPLLACVALSLGFGIVGGRAQQPVGGLPEDLIPSLRPIIEEALSQSPQMMTRGLELAQAEANRYFSTAALLPTVSGSVQYAISTSTVSTVRSVSSDSDGLFYGFSLGQPLFQWGALRAQANVAQIAVLVSEKQYAEAYRLLVHSLRVQYLALIARKANLNSLRQRLERAEGVLAVEEDKLANGALSPGGIIAIRMEVTELRLLLEQTGSDLAYSLLLFARLVGRPDFPVESLPDEIPRPVEMAATADQLLSSFLRQGAEATPQGEIYSLYIKQADLNYHIAKTRLYPKFSLYAGYSLINSTSASLNTISQVGVTSLSYGVVASWTIFDGFSTRGSKLSALATRRTNERQLRTYADSVMDGAQNLHRQLGFSLRGLALAEQRRDLARDMVRNRTEDIELGAGSRVELDAALAAFGAADLAATYARSEYLGRWSEFLSLIGADPALNLLPSRYVRANP